MIDYDAILSQFSKLDSQETEFIAKAIFEKKYLSSDLSFIENPSRTLNYWGSEPNILPFDEEEGKRRHFSFFDIIWLKIVNELRSFGMGKEAIAIVKKNLLTPMNLPDIVQNIKENKEAIQKMLSMLIDTDSGAGNKILDQYLNNLSELEDNKTSKLFGLSFYSLGQKKIIRLIISKKGSVHEYLDSTNTPLEKIENDNADLKEGYIIIHLSNIITKSIGLPCIKDRVKESFLNEQEWKIILLLRKEKPKSLKIHMGEGQKVDLVEITKLKKVEMEARLIEIMIKDAYEKLEVVTVKGKIAYCLSTVSQKL